MVLTDWEPRPWLCCELGDSADLLRRVTWSPSAKMGTWVHVGPSNEGSEPPGFAKHCKPSLVEYNFR